MSILEDQHKLDCNKNSYFLIFRIFEANRRLANPDVIAK